MPEMTMHTRRSARNLQQLARPEQINESGDDENCRNYDLNYDRAMRKKLNACNMEYLVTRAEKGENHVFGFSTAMYELYRTKLSEHFQSMNNDPDLNIKVSFKDVTEKTGMVVESVIKVHQRTQNGCGRPKYTEGL